MYINVCLFYRLERIPLAVYLSFYLEIIELLAIKFAGLFDEGSAIYILPMATTWINMIHALFKATF